MKDYSSKSFKFKKDSVEVEAIRWTGDNFEEVKTFFGKDAKDYSQLSEVIPNRKIKGNLRIETPEGDYTALPDDFIIRGSKGGYYTCKPDIFMETYEAIIGRN